MHLPLTPRDDALLTAKAIAFRTLSSLEKLLFVSSEGSEDHPARGTVLSAVSGFTSFKELQKPLISTPEFLSSVREHLVGTIAKTCDNGRVVSDIFAHAFISEAERYISIVAEIQRWMHDLTSFAMRYFTGFEISIPTTMLQLRIDPYLNVAIGGVTVPTASGREISLVINPTLFSISDYFSLPCVLSHEFWCHALSSIVIGRATDPGEEWAGCRPNDIWEEGWMDFVQGETLISELSTFVSDSPALQFHFSRHSKAELSTRQSPGNSILLARGAGAAEALLRVLRQYYHKTGGDDLFLQLSVGLNALRCPEQFKVGFVEFVWQSLNPGSSSVGANPALLVMSRHELHEIMKPFIAYKRTSDLYVIDIEGLISATLHQNN